MDKLKSVQDKLCAGLSGDPDYILDQCGDILSVNEFREIQKQSSALDKMRVLLNIIIQKGEETCLRFIHILGQHKAHYHQLQRLFNPNTAGKDLPGKRALVCTVYTASEPQHALGFNYARITSFLQIVIEVLKDSATQVMMIVIYRATRSNIICWWLQCCYCQTTNKYKRKVCQHEDRNSEWCRTSSIWWAFIFLKYSL